MRVTVSIDIGESDMDIARRLPVSMADTDGDLFRLAADQLVEIADDIRRMYPPPGGKQ
jgi:hypothetical protein